MNINEHPIYKQIYELCLEIEKLPASEQETKVVVMAGELEKPVAALIKERDGARAVCAESAVEIKRLRHEVVDRIVKCERLTKERDEARAACADELHENLELFALLGLNSNEDFGNDTSTKALRKRIEALIGERDEARAACAEIRGVVGYALVDRDATDSATWRASAEHALDSTDELAKKAYKLLETE